jgi:NodT family efflux transporter outer membrane factor (OMF) lipoprotein
VSYFILRGLDAQRQLLDFTITAFERAVALTINRYDAGVASQAEVLQARTQLENTRAQATDVGVQRAQFEHAIAILLGQPPAAFSLPPTPITGSPPAIPLSLPSELLERRPDIASAERRVAAANAQIGIAEAAFYPTVTLRSVVGLESSSLTNLFSWPSALWSLGAAVVEIVFDGGRRQAVTEQARAAYDATVALYRQTVLTAFQSVEDTLSTLRILEEEATQQARAVQVAEAALLLALNRYKGGITTYLEVVVVQSAALTAERIAIDLLTRRMAATVQLIKALGGLWGTSST